MVSMGGEYQRGTPIPHDPRTLAVFWGVSHKITLALVALKNHTTFPWWQCLTQISQVPRGLQGII